METTPIGHSQKHENVIGVNQQASSTDSSGIYGTPCAIMGPPKELTKENRARKRVKPVRVIRENMTIISDDGTDSSSTISSPNKVPKKRKKRIIPMHIKKVNCTAQQKNEEESVITESSKEEHKNNEIHNTLSRPFTQSIEVTQNRNFSSNHVVSDNQHKLENKLNCYSQDKSTHNNQENLEPNTIDGTSYVPVTNIINKNENIVDLHEPNYEENITDVLASVSENNVRVQELLKQSDVSNIMTREEVTGNAELNVGNISKNITHAMMEANENLFKRNEVQKSHHHLNRNANYKNSKSKKPKISECVKESKCNKEKFYNPEEIRKFMRKKKQERLARENEIKLEKIKQEEARKKKLEAYKMYSIKPSLANTNKRSIAIQVDKPLNKCNNFEENDKYSTCENVNTYRIMDEVNESLIRERFTKDEYGILNYVSNIQENDAERNISTNPGCNNLMEQPNPFLNESHLNEKLYLLRNVDKNLITPSKQYVYEREISSIFPNKMRPIPKFPTQVATLPENHLYGSCISVHTFLNTPTSNQKDKTKIESHFKTGLQFDNDENCKNKFSAFQSAVTVNNSSPTSQLGPLYSKLDSQNNSPKFYEETKINMCSKPSCSTKHLTDTVCDNNTPYTKKENADFFRSKENALHPCQSFGPSFLIENYNADTPLNTMHFLPFNNESSSCSKFKAPCISENNSLRIEHDMVQSDADRIALDKSKCHLDKCGTTCINFGTGISSAYNDNIDLKGNVSLSDVSYKECFQNMDLNKYLDECVGIKGISSSLLEQTNFNKSTFTGSNYAGDAKTSNNNYVTEYSSNISVTSRRSSYRKSTEHKKNIDGNDCLNSSGTSKTMSGVAYISSSETSANSIASVETSITFAETSTRQNRISTITADESFAEYSPSDFDISVTGFSLNMYDQLIKDEDCKLQQQLQKLNKYKNDLLIYVKKRILALEVQKAEYRNSNDDKNVTILKKKQRAILLKVNQNIQKLHMLEEAVKKIVEDRKLKLINQKENLQGDSKSKAKRPNFQTKKKMCVQTKGDYFSEYQSTASASFKDHKVLADICNSYKLSDDKKPEPVLQNTETSPIRFGPDELHNKKLGLLDVSNDRVEVSRNPSWHDEKENKNVILCNDDDENESGRTITSNLSKLNVSGGSKIMSSDTDLLNRSIKNMSDRHLINAPIKEPLSPSATVLKKLHLLRNSNDDSPILSFNDTTLSEQSDVELRISALKDELHQRKMEASKLRSIQKQIRREKLRAQELSLIKQIEAYDQYIEKINKELKNVDTVAQITKPVIKRPGRNILLYHSSLSDSSHSSLLSNNIKLNESVLDKRISSIDTVEFSKEPTKHSHQNVKTTEVSENLDNGPQSNSLFNETFMAQIHDMLLQGNKITFKVENTYELPNSTSSSAQTGPSKNNSHIFIQPYKEDSLVNPAEFESSDISIGENENLILSTNECDSSVSTLKNDSGKKLKLSSDSSSVSHKTASVEPLSSDHISDNRKCGFEYPNDTSQSIEELLTDQNSSSQLDTNSINRENKPFSDINNISHVQDVTKNVGKPSQDGDVNAEISELNKSVFDEMLCESDTNHSNSLLKNVKKVSRNQSDDASMTLSYNGKNETDVKSSSKVDKRISMLCEEPNDFKLLSSLFPEPLWSNVNYDDIDLEELTALPETQVSNIDSCQRIDSNILTGSNIHTFTNISTDTNFPTYSNVHTDTNIPTDRNIDIDANILAISDIHIDTNILTDPNIDTDTNILAISDIHIDTNILTDPNIDTDTNFPAISDIHIDTNISTDPNIDTDTNFIISEIHIDTNIPKDTNIDTSVKTASFENEISSRNVLISGENESDLTEDISEYLYSKDEKNSEELSDISESISTMSEKISHILSISTEKSSVSVNHMSNNSQVSSISVEQHSVPESSASNNSSILSVYAENSTYNSGSISDTKNIRSTDDDDDLNTNTEMNRSSQRTDKSEDQFMLNVKSGNTTDEEEQSKTDDTNIKENSSLEKTDESEDQFMLNVKSGNTADEEKQRKTDDTSTKMNKSSEKTDESDQFMLNVESENRTEEEESSETDESDANIDVDYLPRFLRRYKPERIVNDISIEELADKISAIPSIHEIDQKLKGIRSKWNTENIFNFPASDNKHEEIFRENHREKNESYNSIPEQYIQNNELSTSHQEQHTEKDESSSFAENISEQISNIELIVDQLPVTNKNIPEYTVDDKKNSEIFCDKYVGFKSAENISYTSDLKEIQNHMTEIIYVDHECNSSKMENKSMINDQYMDSSKKVINEIKNKYDNNLCNDLKELKLEGISSIENDQLQNDRCTIYKNEMSREMFQEHNVSSLSHEMYQDINNSMTDICNETFIVDKTSNSMVNEIKSEDVVRFAETILSELIKDFVSDKGNGQNSGKFKTFNIRDIDHMISNSETPFLRALVATSVQTAEDITSSILNSLLRETVDFMIQIFIGHFEDCPIPNIHNSDVFIKEIDNPESALSSEVKFDGNFHKKESSFIYHNYNDQLKVEVNHDDVETDMLSSEDWFDEDFGIGRNKSREAEELRKQQIQIEQEIKEIQARQKHIPPYIYFREIPNKPPPPYTPPTSQISPKIPNTAEEISNYIENFTDIISKAFEGGVSWDEIQLANEYRKWDKNVVVFKKFLFDLTKELFGKVYNRRNENTSVPWERLVKNMNHIAPVLTKEQLTSAIKNEALAIFGFKSKIKRENAIIRWSRKKKTDYVDELLIRELQEEEPEWTNYETDEIVIKNRITCSILDDLLLDTSNIINVALNKKLENYHITL